MPKLNKKCICSEIVNLLLLKFTLNVIVLKFFRVNLYISYCNLAVPRCVPFPEKNLGPCQEGLFFYTICGGYAGGNTHMSYYENIFNRNTKRDTAGRSVYFIFGWLGGGRIVDSPAVERRLTTFLKYHRSFLVTIILAIAAGNGYAWHAVTAYFAVYCIGAFYILSSCTPSEERMTFREYVGNTAKFDYLHLRAAAIAGGLLLAACSYLVVAGNTPQNRFLGGAGALFFAYLELETIWAMKIKSSQSSSL